MAAQIIATIDDVSKGRFGINIVTGSFLDEYEQMGSLPADYNVKRYNYAEEWLHVVKRLWAEDLVTFDGEWFHLKDCRSGPIRSEAVPQHHLCRHIRQKIRFTAKEGNYSSSLASRSTIRRS